MGIKKWFKKEKTVSCSCTGQIKELFKRADRMETTIEKQEEIIKQLQDSQSATGAGIVYQESKDKFVKAKAR